MTNRMTVFPYTPDYAVPPGETLFEWVEDNHRIHEDVAFFLGLSTDELVDLFAGRMVIDEKLAIKLDTLTAIREAWWTSRERWYREQTNA